MNPQNIPTHLLVTGSLMVLLIVGFLAIFLVPGLLQLLRLRAVLGKLQASSGKTTPSEFKQIFSTDKVFAHLWSEFAETLHSQNEQRDGVLEVIAVRATVPSDSYFNGQLIVDSQLQTEFFKHLPGIFTGLGIIGTFSGLIDGLQRFQVSANPNQVRSSLEALMHSVGEAFLVSAAAIAAAMLVTFIEKLILASLYRKTEAISQEIDACFQAGAGEEYLSRLVTASESSATQSKILKDALVEDLGKILREISATQLTASKDNNQSLAETITASIERSLQEPLKKIASSVETAAGDQSNAAVQMLNDVMVSFSQRLNDLFGGQINGINELNRQSAQAMQDAVSALNALVQKLEDSGRKSADSLSDVLASSIKAMEERQMLVNKQTEEFINQIRQLVSTSQNETQQKLQQTLEELGKQMSALIGDLNNSQNRSFEENRSRETAMSTHVQTTISGISDAVESAAKEITAASLTMSQAVSSMVSATTSNIDKMNASAARIDTAAGNFATAGERVTGVMEKTSVVAEKLTSLGGALTSSSTSLQDVLRDYKLQRDSVVSLLSEVNGAVDLAKREASMTADVLQRIEESTNRLKAAQKAADEYLDGVNSVLAGSTEAFRESVVSTLSKVNHDFHTKLTQAVALLSGSVNELEVTLGALTPRR